MSAKRYVAFGLAIFILGSCQTPGRVGGPVPELSKQEMQSRFIEKGYESASSTRSNDDYDAYIERQGTPEAISREHIVNRQDKIEDEMVTLRYPGYEMRYLAYSPRELWHPPKSVLMAVLSRAGGKYLFGVEIGMRRGKILEILGLAETGKPEMVLRDEQGHRAMLSFEDGVIAGIIWDYSGD